MASCRPQWMTVSMARSGPVLSVAARTMLTPSSAMLKAWNGPFGDVRFCPTGGITVANASEFLALPNVVCVGGSWLTPADALARGDWAHITALAREACQLGRTPI